MTPLDISSAVASGVVTAIRAAIFILELAEAPDEARILCRLINRIHEDREEALRLLDDPAVKARFELEPRDRGYVEGTIKASSVALVNIGRVLEKIRVDDQSTGTLRFDRRVNWVMQLQRKSMLRERELATCHRSLLHAMSMMQNWVNSSQLSLPTYEQAITPADEAFLNMRKRHARARKSISEACENKAALQPPDTEAFNEPTSALESKRSLELPQFDFSDLHNFDNFSSTTLGGDIQEAYDIYRNDTILPEDRIVAPSSEDQSSECGSLFSAIFSPLEGPSSFLSPVTPNTPFSLSLEFGKSSSVQARLLEARKEKEAEISQGADYFLNCHHSDDWSNEPSFGQPKLKLPSDVSGEYLQRETSEPDLAAQKPEIGRQVKNDIGIKSGSRFYSQSDLPSDSLESELNELSQRYITTMRLAEASSSRSPEIPHAAHVADMSDGEVLEEIVQAVTVDTYYRNTLGTLHPSSSDTMTVHTRTTYDRESLPSPGSQRSSILMSGAILPLSQCTTNSIIPPARTRSALETRRARRRLIASGIWQSPYASIGEEPSSEEVGHQSVTRSSSTTVERTKTTHTGWFKKK